MELRYKEDWPQARERIEAWWQGEIVDRVAIRVNAPNGRPRRSVEPPADALGRWTDVDFIVENYEAHFEATYFGGESLPCAFVNLGPSVVGAYLGCPLHHDERTAWQDRIIDEPSDWANVRFDADNKWWKLTKQITEALVESGQGRYFVTHTDMGDATDVMSYMRDPANLCIDLLEIPQTVYAVRDQITDLWFKLYDELFSIVQTRMTGSTSWLQIWSPGKTYTLQSDFSCMISAPMYREYVLPEVQSMAKWLDHSIYHLDGPGAIQHLDMLLEVPELHGIQWVPGAGASPAREWPDLIKKVQAAGKLLDIGVHKDDIEPLLEIVSPKGLLINSGCSTPDEARDLLRNAERWTARAMRGR
jgi:hypothetical protein